MVDRATIEDLNGRLVAAFTRGDAEAAAAFYTEDAALMPPGAPMLRGRAAIAAFWTEAARHVGSLTLTTLDLKPLGTDAAREIGAFRMLSRAEPATEFAGKYVVIWERTAAGWQLATDIWNSDG